MIELSFFKIKKGIFVYVQIRTMKTELLIAAGMKALSQNPALCIENAD